MVREMLTQTPTLSGNLVSFKTDKLLALFTIDNEYRRVVINLPHPSNN